MKKSKALKEIHYRWRAASDSVDPSFELVIKPDGGVAFNGFDNCICEGETQWEVPGLNWENLMGQFQEHDFFRMEGNYSAIQYPPQNCAYSELIAIYADGKEWRVINRSPAGFGPDFDLTIPNIDKALRTSWGMLLDYLSEETGNGSKWSERIKNRIFGNRNQEKQNYQIVLRLIYLEESVMRAADIYRCVEFGEWKPARDPENDFPED